MIAHVKVLFCRQVIGFFVIAVACMAGSFSGSAFAGAKVLDREGLMAAIRSDGHAKVIVRLNADATERLIAASSSHKLLAPGNRASLEMQKADRALTDHIESVSLNVLAKLGSADYRVNRTYRLFPLLALDVSEETLSALESLPEVISISADRSHQPPEFKADRVGLVSPDLPQALRTPQLYPANYDTIGAEKAWGAGYTGKGWYVAILDTGVLVEHELFAGKDVVEACFAGNGDCPNGDSTMVGSGAAAPFNSSYDGYEHGTHVAGIAVGNSGSVFGVAKDANLIAVQVFTGYTSAEKCGKRPSPCAKSLTSDQIAALDYVYSLRGNYPIASVNMSLGGDVYSDQAACDADHADIKLPIDMLRDAGVATVISSGNEYYCNAVGEPGCVSSAISVGAVDDNDVQVDYSNWHYSLLKLLAPGYHIYSGLPDSSTSYGYLSGTSMAAPHVAGAWAILREQNAYASVSDLYYALAATGVSVHSDCPHINDFKPRIQIDAALSPSIMNAPVHTYSFSYDPTASPTFGISGRPVGVGTVSGTGSILDLRVGFYQFSAPVDIYLALYAPVVDPSNYYLVMPGSAVRPLSPDGPAPWKSGVTGPIDESLFGPLSSSVLPSGTYSLYILVTPSGALSPYYLWQTDFVK